MKAAGSFCPASKAWIWYRIAFSSRQDASTMDTRAELASRAGNETSAVFGTRFGAFWAGLAVMRVSFTLARTDFLIPAHPALGMFEPTCCVPVGFRTTSFHIISTVWVYPTTVCAATVNLGSHVAVPATYVLDNLVPGQSPSCLTTFRV